MSRPTQSSARPSGSPLPRTVNTQTKVFDSGRGRILCIADIRGKLSSLNDLAQDAGAVAVIHTGDFGFFEENSLDRINDRALRHLTMYSPLIPSEQRNSLLAPDNPASAIRSALDISMISEFPLLLSGQIQFHVPVYTTWGTCEDVFVIEKFRSGNSNVDNLHIIDEATTRCLDIGGVKLRLLGLGGALVPHRMFDNGDGNATIAGGQGTMWTTALQIGELVDTAQRVFDQTETRLLVTHASPGREGIMAQLALVLKADLTISAGLHFRYATSYNEFSVQGDFEGFRRKLVSAKEQFDSVWDSVKTQVDAVIDDNQRVLLNKALSVVERLPPTQGASNTGPAAGAGAGEEPAWKNCWNWNLCDAAYGSLVLDVREGRISAELKSQGFNYAYRRTATSVPTPTASTTPLPTNNITSSAPSNNPKGTSPPPNRDATKTGNNANPDKGEKHKKKKDRKDKEKPDTVDTPSSTTSVDPDQKPDPEDLKSPITDPGSGGARTPKGNKPQRNPWTIFMRMTVSVNEAELKDFFGEAQGGITKVHFPQSFPGRQQKLAYVEFGDEEAMKAGLEKHSEKLKDTIPEVKQATDRESRGETQHRGGPRGRGRGGLAARGLAAAGLTKHRTNGDVADGVKGSVSGGDGA